MKRAAKIRSPATPVATPVPAKREYQVKSTLTEERAASFVKLMHAGLPPDKAVIYIIPEANPEQAARISAMWANAPLTLAATIVFTRGEWASLDADTRLAIARDKFLAEQAYFLYTHQYATLDGVDLGKAKYAYEAISAYLSAQGSGGDDPLARFLKDLQSGKADERVDAPILVPAELVPAMGKQQN